MNPKFTIETLESWIGKKVSQYPYFANGQSRFGTVLHVHQADDGQFWVGVDFDYDKTRGEIDTGPIWMGPEHLRLVSARDTDRMKNKPEWWKDGRYLGDLHCIVAVPHLAHLDEEDRQVALRFVIGEVIEYIRTNEELYQWFGQSMIDKLLATFYADFVECWRQWGKLIEFLGRYGVTLQYDKYATPDVIWAYRNPKDQ